MFFANAKKYWLEAWNRNPENKVLEEQELEGPNLCDDYFKVIYWMFVSLEVAMHLHKSFKCKGMESLLKLCSAFFCGVV